MLEIVKDKERQHIILRLKGEVDASNSVELDQAIQEALNEKENKIMIDGESLDYISSAGLGVFLSYLEDFQDNKIQLVIYGLNEKVKNVFHILGLDQLIEIKGTEDEAVYSLYGA